jgi:ribose-phosphate pyrophosphokinase
MKYERLRYPDGGVYARITDFDNPTIVERINSYEDLFFIKSLKEVCDYNEIENVSLVIPCMFQQQHDRRFKENESFEIKIVADFINSCNFKKVFVHHPHSDVTHALINRCHVIDNTNFIISVIGLIAGQEVYKAGEVLKDKVILMSSDAGGFKPLIKLADVIEWSGETESAAKSRNPDTHKLTQVIDKQDFEGKDILIVDDLCVYGGTFVGLAKMLKDRNAGKLYLAVSHITVPNPNPELNTHFEKIFTTNSKYDKYDIDVHVIKMLGL